jgi:hypothetical protein
MKRMKYLYRTKHYKTKLMQLLFYKYLLLLRWQRAIISVANNWIIKTNFLKRPEKQEIDFCSKLRPFLPSFVSSFQPLLLFFRFFFHYFALKIWKYALRLVNRFVKTKSSFLKSKTGWIQVKNGSVGRTYSKKLQLFKLKIIKVLRLRCFWLDVRCSLKFFFVKKCNSNSWKSIQCEQ